MEKIKDLPGTTRAAILLMSLDNKEAAEVLKHMGPKQVQKLGIAMATLKDVSKEQLEAVLTQFLDQAEQQTSLGIGSDEYIRSLLVNALGEEKAGGVIDRILLGANTKGLDTLKWMEPRAISDIIRYEHPQIQSIVLSYIDPDQAGQVLAFFDERVRLDLMLRISSTETVQPAALQELNDIMERQFSGGTSAKTRPLGGIKTAADIMNFLDSSIEEKLMQQLKERDPELGQGIQDLMFVFENLLDVDDRGIQTILREVSSEALLLALKGADNSMRQKVFKNMSKRAAELLKDDLEAKGPVKVSEVEGAQKEILTIARRLSESGEISLGKGGEEMI
ncbi:MAG: flagellar motor switch protein FliG [Gammaproteobacteria bacterium]